MTSEPSQEYLTYLQILSSQLQIYGGQIQILGNNIQILANQLESLGSVVENLGNIYQNEGNKIAITAVLLQQNQQGSKQNGNDQDIVSIHSQLNEMQIQIKRILDRLGNI